MNNRYFELDEDFETIIKNTLKNKNVKTLKQISTGWTNIVYEASTDEGNYFFRFPRDDFWARTIVKDCAFSKFIKGKTNYSTVDLKLCYDNNRPFSVHKKIEGTALAEKMVDLSKEQIDEISGQIADFMYQLHNVEYKEDDIRKTEDSHSDLVSFLDELLNLHVSKQDMKFWNLQEFSKKQSDCLVHGDLNSSNVLLDENNKVTGFIDFGFSGFGNKYFDIARIIGRGAPTEFKKSVIENYEKISNEKLDKQVIETESKLWEDIDNAYINYMRKIGIYE